MLASLSHPANSPVTFDLATADDTATAGVDYVPMSTMVTIPAGRTTRVLSVMVKGDTADEGDESFDLLVSNVAGAAFDGGLSVLRTTISDDDDAAVLRLLGGTVDEGTGGDRYLTVTARLSHPSKTPVTFSYRTADQTAAAGMDYVAASGTVTLPAGRTSQTLDFTILGDGEAEPDERFDVFIDSVSGATYDAFASTAFGTIRDDDLPTFKVEGSTAYEGDAATRELCFTVTLARTTAAPVTVTYHTENSSATAPSDFVSESGSFTIPPGQKTWPVCITIVGDTVPEPDEQFELRVSPVSGAIYDAGASSPYGRINNDDGPPVLTIRGSSAFEGAAGTRGLRFERHSFPRRDDFAPVRLHRGERPDRCRSGHGGSDFDDSMNAFVFAPGSTYREFFITVYGDTEPEVDEVFKVKVAPMGSGGHTYDESASDPYGHILDDDDVADAPHHRQQQHLEGNAGISRPPSQRPCPTRLTCP